MMLAGFFLLLLTVDGASSGDNCSYQYLLNYLNLTSKNELYYMSRPVKNHSTTTTVNLDMLTYAILDMRETEQTFIPYVWILMNWNNEYIKWNSDDFCGLEHIIVPANILWKPDLTIEEMTEKDKAPPSPYLKICNDGVIEYKNDQVLVSTCRMQVYKFPFDTQSCNLTFKSIVHPVEEMKIKVFLKSDQATVWSLDLMKIQYEWLYMGQTVTIKTVDTFGFNQSLAVFTITMKRRSILYIVNFMLPVLFFLCLDLASFLISDSGGEKLSFKVTVLLAVTVMQLILNNILPSSSDKAPLIAVYCIGIFSMMLLSLLETIVVMYLMEKDSEDKRGDRDQSLKVRKLIHCACADDVSADETLPELQPVAREGSSSLLTDDSQALEKLSYELKEMEKMLTLLLNSRKEEVKPGYWTRLTKTINRVFLIFYVTLAVLFFVFIFLKWNRAEDK